LNNSIIEEEKEVIMLEESPRRQACILVCDRPEHVIPYCKEFASWRIVDGSVIMLITAILYNL